MKIYVASSWRNAPYYTQVLELCRSLGHDTYDFRNDENAFAWGQIDLNWREWDVASYVTALDHQLSQRGFLADMQALKECDACILILPCGKSAHLEAGWAAGRGKKTAIFMPEIDRSGAELMYLMADDILVSLPEVAEWVYEMANALKTKTKKQR